MEFKTLLVERDGHVVHVKLNRIAMNNTFWHEYRQCFEALAKDKECRAIVVSSNVKFFTAGLDLKDAADLAGSGGETDVARKAWAMRGELLNKFQAAFTAMENCPQPVISCCHGAVIGAGVDLITACDIRLATTDAWFSIKEVDVGLAADVGTLQRLHHVMGNNSLARELAYTARKFTSAEAKEAGLLSSVHQTKAGMIAHAMDMAKTISEKSPIAIAGTKINLNYSREHTIKDSLDYMAVWNMAMLQTEDMPKSAMASISKSGPPEFSKL